MQNPLPDVLLLLEGGHDRSTPFSYLSRLPNYAKSRTLCAYNIQQSSRN